MKIHFLIKTLRIKQGISQQSVSEGIMSRSAYSKFELGERALTTSEFNSIMNRLDAHITDLSDIANMEDPDSLRLRELTYQSYYNSLNLQEVNKLYRELKRKREESIDNYRNYLIIKYRFAKKSETIPPISSEEVNKLLDKIKEKKYLTNYYIQLIMDFTPIFNSEQLIYLFVRLKTYKIDWISPIECQYMYILPGAISNIADSLIDCAIVDIKKIDRSLLVHAEEACNKLTEIMELRPSLNYNLLLKLHRIRIEYYAGKNKKAKKEALTKALKFKQELEFLVELKGYDDKKIETTADIALNSINNLINQGKPGEIEYFFV
ncbi:helix-turn-helix domain-containing protein [Enterococcus faecium]|uniref:helix-turn-helix domain-containing protein n=1 Tax=Enterococcus faecium TaxID=1352 RepID=UPI000B6ECF30|nr:helix-turn-helix transcriptional regulator [Enterococcus faecium]OTO49802.1 hypothetical protein A5814_002890 [Enterococcus faecium]